MNYEVAWEDEAFAAAQAFMADDPAGLVTVFDAVDGLAVNPRPATAFPWGTTSFFRLRVGRYRVMYEIDDRMIRIDVLHLGRGG